MKIIDICDLNKASVSKKERVGKIQYLDTSNITKNFIGSFQNLDFDKAPSRAQRKVADKTILYSTVRPNQEHYGIMEKPAANMIVSTGFTTIDIKEEFKNDFDAYYLYYLLTQKWVTERLQSIADNSTTSYPSIRPEDLGELSFSFPCIKIQKKIGAVLKALDDKIHLNEQINRNLEELARLIYDYWFVQFDFPNKNGKPYKSSGGKMVWNEKLKRNIPAGWQTAKVRDVILPIERGISYSSDEITDPNGTPMINLACFDKKGNYRTGEFKYFTGKFKNEDKIYPFDMLIACTDLTQKADIIGTPIFSPTEYPFYVFSMDLVKITPIRSNDKQFLYYYLKHPAFHHYIKPFASGTTVKHLRVDGLLDYPIFMPDESVRDAFAEVMEPIRHKIADNTSQGVELSKMRDYLLPLLMNGQVSVKSSNGSK